MDYSFLANPGPGVQLPDPYERESKRLTLAHLAGQQQIQQYQMEKAQQADAEAKALNAALPALLQGGYSPQAIQQALQQNPQAASAILGAVDARKKAQLDQDKERAGIDKDRASTGETQAKTKEIMLKQVGGGAFELANKPDLNPSDIEGFYTKAKAIGLPMEQFGTPQGNDADAWRAHLKQIANFTVSAPDQIRFAGDAAQRTETNRHNSNTEAISAANLSEQARYHTGELGIQGGRLGLERDRLAFDQSKDANKPERALTETQGNATAFGMRANAANQIFSQLEDKGFSPNNPMNKLAESGWTNFAAPEDAQTARQAKLNFMTATLRKESGAAISPSEFETEDKKYFPQMGDKPANIAQKRQARELAIRTLQVQAGQGAKQINETSASPGGAPIKIKGDDGYNALPSGAIFVGPDGVTRKKP